MSIKGLNMIGPHHICVLYVATAGLQGPLMGSDEQEIVLLIYVIVDVIQNKIVGVQQYPIRPLTADTQENILSEQLTSESVLTDELIKSAGRQLVDALQEFDAYCNSLHLDPHNAGFRLITDGQLPLRQCLYPEACRKDLEVPNYYSTFYDLRKEVARYLTSTGAVVNNNNNNNNNNNINNNGSRQMTPGATTTLATSAPAVVENGITTMSTGTSLLPLPDKTHTIPALGMAAPNTHLPTAALILQQAVKQLTSGSAITTVAPPAAPTSSSSIPTTTDQQQQQQQNGGAGEVLMPQSVADMLECLQMNAESENEFYKREAKDMVNIVQRLITEGHRFEVPETINLTLEPGICSKDDEIDNNCVVRARGLPWQSSDQDIAKFFSGLNVAKGGVALCLSHQGRRNGEALVRFENQEHRDMALKRHKHHIGQRYIEVYRASGDDFLSVAGGKSSEAQAFLSRGAAVIVRMRGLPYDCTAKQVLEFFSSGENACTVLDGNDGVLFVRKLDGRATGDAFVLFSSETDAPKALSKHRECIGSRYIELFRSTTAEVQQVLNRSLESRPYEPEPLTPILPHLPLLPQHIITSGTKKDCIRLRGLPYEAQVEHILDFLGEYSKNIIFQGVHMVYNAQGQPSGEAFIQMDSEQSAGLTAQNKHHRYIFIGKKQRYIEVFQCSGEDMNLVLTGGIPAPGSPATKPQQVAAAAAAALLSPGGSIIPTAFHPGPNFPGYAPVQLAAAAAASPLGPPRQFLPPPIFYWPYPSPPVSPTNYYPTMAPPPPMGPQQPPPQTMLPPELVAMQPMGHMPTMDARLIQDGLGLHRPSDHDKARQNFIPNQYVELII